MSAMSSAYSAKHIFIRCPECGRDYPISDPEVVASTEYLELYKQRRGKDYEVQCNQIYSEEHSAAIRRILRETKPPCVNRFTLHEGLVEHKADAPTEWFSRGPYTQVEEGFVDLRIGQAVQPNLLTKFSWIDYVILFPGQSSPSGALRMQWRRTGDRMDRFVILTSTEHEEDLGKAIRVNWQAAGLRQLSDREKEQMKTETWRKFLISSASKLLYERDPAMSVLESWTAFETFLETFIEDNWKSPHLEDNREYLRRVAGFSIETKARILLHEALGIPFVKSTVWKNWLWAKSCRNQVAHGRPLEDAERGSGTNRSRIGNRFDDKRVEIAKFCYSSVVRAIYFIRYWDVASDASRT
jgi:hypothetical protein